MPGRVNVARYYGVAHGKVRYRKWSVGTLVRRLRHGRDGGAARKRGLGILAQQLRSGVEFLIGQKATFDEVQLDRGQPALVIRRP
jgi:hypothetical protein